MHAQLEHVVARHLRVVGGVVSGFPAFIMQALGFPVGLNGQVATRTAGGPAQVAGEAGHLVVVVRQLFYAWSPFPVLAFCTSTHQFGACSFGVVLRVCRVHIVFHQAHFPFFGGVKRSALIQLSISPLKALAAVLGSQLG